MKANEFVIEAHAKQQLSVYNPQGTTYRQQPMPTLEPDPMDQATPLSQLSRDERLDYSSQERAETNVDRERLARLMPQLLKLIPPRLRTVVQLRFGNDMTLEEIGEYLGVGTERARQLLAKAMRLMRYHKVSDRLRHFLDDPRQYDSRVDQ